jgi:hypothetical protein
VGGIGEMAVGVTSETRERNERSPANPDQIATLAIIEG